MTNLWISLFGTSEFLGVDIGFWVSMAVCLLIVIAMNAVFWSMKPIEKAKVGDSDETDE